MCDLFVHLDSSLTSPSISSMTIGGGGVVSTASVGSNPFAVGGIYPAAVPVQASPQYMLVQTGSGPCYVPVTNVPFGPAVMSPPPAFSTPAAAQFQLPNPQQQASFAFHGQMHPANPFLVIVFLMLCLPYFHTWYGLSADLGCRSETCCTRLAENTGCKKIAKNSPSGHHRTNLSAYICYNQGMYRQSEKNMLNSNMFPTCPCSMVNLAH